MTLFVLVPVVISVIAAWNMRRWWNNSIPSHSHTVSRRRKFVRDSTIGRRPPPLPAIVQDRSSLKIYLQTERSGWSLKKRGSVSKSEEVSVMPGGRRSLARSSTSRQPPSPPNTLPLSEDAHKSRSPGQTTPDTPASRILSPKHIPIPSVPHDGSVMFEVVMFMFTATASFLQFLHLYRTVWWLPQSYTKYAMNFYLMDPYLVGFIATILSRRLVYCMLSRVVTSWSPINLWPLLQQLLRLLLLTIVLVLLVWCAYNIMQIHPIVNIFYLCYPISVYFILFGLSVSPFFDVNELPSLTKDECKVRTFNGKPIHNCSLSPQTVREEVELLKTDFNNRMKQILFSSVLNAYYSGFVPCCFAQNHLYYDVYWATQHLVFVWLGCFTMYLVHCYPVKYCDVLHRAALHLGRWARLEGRTSHLPTHIWADSTLWHQGALVKHCKEMYRAEGISIAAEPGNQTHSRFYARGR